MYVILCSIHNFSIYEFAASNPSLPFPLPLALIVIPVLLPATLLSTLVEISGCNEIGWWCVAG